MPDTPEILFDAFISNTTPGATRPKVVTLSDGNMLVAYATEEGGAPGIDIRGQLFDPDGTPIGEELLFDFSLEIDNRTFDMVAVDGNRVAIVVEVRDPTGANRQIENTLFEVSEDGVRIADFGYTTSTGSGKQLLNPTIAHVGSDDDFRQFFIRRDAPDETVSANGLEDGNVLTFDFDRDFRGDAEAELDSTTLENGNIVVVLDRDGRDGREEMILVMIVTPDGDILRQFDLGRSEDQQFEPTVIALIGGGFVVAFTDEDDDIDPVYQVFDANGTGLTGRTEFGTGADVGGSNNNEPALAPLPDGGFVAFYDNDVAEQIRGQRFDAEGNFVGEDFLVSDGSGAQIDATLLADGRVAVSFFVPAEGVVKTAILETAQDEFTITGTTGRDELTGGNASETILGFGGNDAIEGRGGADTIDGGNGNDEINSGGGNDAVEGGAGNDSIDGGGGRDSIDGGIGQDSLDGSFGADTLNGGAGDDVLTGGGGSDTFVFVGNFGDDTITDFDARNNREDIDLLRAVEIGSFEDLASTFSQQGDDVLIDLAGGTITLQNVALADLDANDFLF